MADPAARALPVVAELARAVLTTMTGGLAAVENALLREVELLGNMIAEARREIASLEVGDITDSHIPVATDELDAVVAHTAMATHRILETCETLDAMADRLTDAADADSMRYATTAIYEACGFQDITGQRITKVVKALKSIDIKVGQMLSTFGSTAHRLASARPANGGEPAASAPNDPALLRGPQMPALAIGQSDIDLLLASLE